MLNIFVCIIANIFKLKSSCSSNNYYFYKRMPTRQAVLFYLFIYFFTSTLCLRHLYMWKYVDIHYLYYSAYYFISDGSHIYMIHIPLKNSQVLLLPHFVLLLFFYLLFIFLFPSLSSFSCFFSLSSYLMPFLLFFIFLLPA